MQDLQGDDLIVGVCVPCRDEVMTGFAFDFARLVSHDAITRCKDGQGGLKMYTMPGTLIFDQREKLVEVALKEGCDAVLFIDSDMRFPADTVEILLSREQPIVGVNAVTRRKPVLPTALNLKVERQDGKVVRHKWEKVDSAGKEGIEPVSAIGFGVTMIRKEVFQKMPRPWFDVGWGKAGIVGEDVHFCIRAMDAGFQPYVDHSLSKFIGHIGTYEYRWSDVKEGAVEAHNNGDH